MMKERKTTQQKKKGGGGNRNFLKVIFKSYITAISPKSNIRFSHYEAKQ